MKWVASAKPDQNSAAIDPWTVVHFATGLACGLMEVPFRWVLVGSLVYEVVEQIAEREEVGQELFESSGPETLPNAVVDMVAITVGHRLGRRWNRTGPARGRP